ncbi:MAG: hypothetical protein LBR27_06310, partial [Bifidobacteriaceae bacterium]|nr:hypothetical protein [Bifidobacteriaceae bacterium]
TDYVSYRSGSVEGSLPNALAWAKPPALPPLVAAARRQLRAAIDEGNPRASVLAWSSLISTWGKQAKEAIPEMLEAIPFSPVSAANFLADCQVMAAVEPLIAQLDAWPRPEYIAEPLARLTGDDSWRVKYPR